MILLVLQSIKNITPMKCPRCESTQLRKNGRSNCKQRYWCKACGKQFLEPLSTPQVSDIKSEAVSVTNDINSEAVSDTTELSELKLQADSMLPLQQTASSSPSDLGIAILLLDAENLKLDIKAEKFLASFCNYPLQVKIAFANWRNHALGKQDLELYERGYQLIHVPGGQNSADAQMIAIGASISRYYSDAKEVLVGSSDWLLINLCNQLQNQGMKVYLVRRQDSTISIENRYSKEIIHYSLTLGMEIPSYEKFVEKVEELIHAEQVSITERIARLSTVAVLFQERRNLTKNNTHLNASSMVKEEQDSIFTILEDESTQYMKRHEASGSKASTETILSDLTTINSIEALEKVLIAIIETIRLETGLDCMPVNNLKQEFQRQYKETADTIVKKFQPNSSLIKFLRSRPSVFKLLTLEGKDHQVAVCYPQP